MKKKLCIIQITFTSFHVYLFDLQATTSAILTAGSTTEEGLVVRKVENLAYPGQLPRIRGSSLVKTALASITFAVTQITMRRACGATSEGRNLSVFVI